MPSTTLHTENAFNSILPSINVFDVDSLIAETFQPLNWAVNGLLPEGCVLFAGRPKLGKSWFVLQLALAVASGGKALGQIPAEQGDVLYLALEDTKRRLQSRVKTLLRGSPVPRGLKMAIDWPRIDKGGDLALEAWLQRNPRTRLLIVDTFGKIKARGKFGDFETLSRLVEIAHKFGICLLVVHHTRKADAADAFDTISGATETASLADAMLVIKRARCSTEAELHVSGRDIDESKKALTFDKETMTWNLLGDADEVWQSRQRTEIKELLRASVKGMGPTEIADCLEKSSVAVRKTLSRMVRDDQIERLSRGLYNLKESDRRAADPEFISREQVRKERTLVFKGIFTRAYGEDNEDIKNFNWDELDISDEWLESVHRIYGKPIVPSDAVKPESPQNGEVSEGPSNRTKSQSKAQRSSRRKRRPTPEPGAGR